MLLLRRAVVVALSALFWAPCIAEAQPTSTPQPALTSIPSATPAAPRYNSNSAPIPAAPSTPGTMSYERFIDGATEQNGLFKVWRKQGRVYFEIAPEQLDHPYLLVPILENGFGRGLYAGLHFHPVLWLFHKANDQILSVEQNPYGKANAGSPAALAVASSYPQSVISSDPIVTVNGANRHLVFAADVLLTDVVDLTDILNGPPGESRSTVRYSFNSRLCYFGATKAFPKNVDVEADLTMTSSTPGFVDTVPDPRSLFLQLHYSIIELPNNGYRPRLADDRVGYFITARRQYDDQETPTSFVRYIRRWNVRKTDPRARLSRASNPIVFYLSNDIPVKYRPPISKALLTWNSAFEAIGISHAIAVRQQPNDPTWDPDDARYSVVRWVVSPDEAFASGQPYSNPLTGEIFRADIIIDGNAVRVGKSALTARIEPTRGATGATQEQQLECSRDDCDFGARMLEQANWASVVLQTEGAFPSDAPPPHWFVESFLRELVLHESGHILGLRHNFRASALYSPAQLHNRRFTEAHGLSASVMDYLPVNISPHGQSQGSYFQESLGPWDYFTIKYGYAPIAVASPQGELSQLRALAAQATKPELAYATDEDAQWDGGFSSDPRVNEFDLGSDPIAYAQGVLAIDRRLFNTLPSRLPRKGESYQQARDAFQSGLRSWWTAATLATHYIGGEYFTRNHRGDPNARLPFAPVPRSEEKRAFDLLDRYVLSDDAFHFPPLLINSLGDDRYSHWQAYPNELGRLDFPLDEYVEAYQDNLLAQMWQPAVLARLASMESRVTRLGDAMSLADLFDWTDRSLWGDLTGGNLHTVPRSHRSLQHFYAEMLVHIMLRPDGGTPNDARTLARHHLRGLRDRLDTVLSRGGLDEATTANLEDIRTLADRALQANVTRPVW